MAARAGAVLPAPRGQTCWLGLARGDGPIGWLLESGVGARDGVNKAILAEGSSCRPLLRGLCVWGAIGRGPAAM